MTKLSQKIFTESEKVIPGGVNSPVRACISVNSFPLVVAKAKGSKFTTVDGEEYIDFVQSWGPLILGHAHPMVTEKIIEAVKRGTSYGAPCEDELKLAQEICGAFPSVEMLRMVNSGTEATMSALRLARGYTKRNKLIKFDGGYHGHADAFLASAGSGVATLSIPGTLGVPACVVSDTLIAPYNDLTEVEKLFKAFPEEIAAVFVEPVAGNMGVILPKENFLQGLRKLCDLYGALLVIDEVITGFRVGYNGAQSYFKVRADLTTMGKIIGGGMPVGAYGGRKEIMQHIAPSGEIYQAGTLSGNPVAMAAGLATLAVLKTADYQALSAKVEKFCQEIKNILIKKSIPCTINQIASMFTIFFTEDKVDDLTSAKKSNTEIYTKIYTQLRAQKINFAPSGFEATMSSFAHSAEDYEKTLEAFSKFKL